MDPSQAELLELTSTEASRIPSHLWPLSSVASSATAAPQLPLSSNLYHWTLQWQQDPALRAKVCCAGQAWWHPVPRSAGLAGAW